MRFLKSTFGFTLTELLVVVAITSILAALIVPGAVRSSHRVTFNNITEASIELFRRARSQALASYFQENATNTESLEIVTGGYGVAVLQDDDKAEAVLFADDWNASEERYVETYLAGSLASSTIVSPDKVFTDSREPQEGDLVVDSVLLSEKTYLEVKNIMVDGQEVDGWYAIFTPPHAEVSIASIENDTHTLGGTYASFDIHFLTGESCYRVELHSVTATPIMSQLESCT